MSMHVIVSSLNSQLPQSEMPDPQLVAAATTALRTALVRSLTLSLAARRRGALLTVVRVRPRR
jgi:hypothetical protein